MKTLELPVGSPGNSTIPQLTNLTLAYTQGDDCQLLEIEFENECGGFWATFKTESWSIESSKGSQWLSDMINKTIETLDGQYNK